MRQSNRDLWRYYDVATAKYFKNKLPKDIPIRFAKLQPHVLGKTYVCNHGIAQGIEISERLRNLDREEMAVSGINEIMRKLEEECDVDEEKSQQ